MKKFFLLIAVIFSVLPVSAYYGTTIGPEVSELNGKKLQWGAGQFDYFVMFKSLMGNDIRDICTDANSPAGCDWSNNPEPDSCLPSSTFQLTNQHIPEDAYVEAAYLVWTSSIDPNNINYTDNTATLNYISDDGQITRTVNATAPRIGTVGTEANPGEQDFTFEGIAAESNGTVYSGYYTYRVDVTNFFNHIQAKGKELGYKSDGMSLYGNYTVSDVRCSNDSAYLSQITGNGSYSASVMCGWSLITVYRSTRVNPKMVYIYNGFGRFCTQEVDLGISGFEFPDKPIIKMTMAVHEGDPGLASATGCGGLLGSGACTPEGLQVTGQTTPPEDLVILQNSCNPAKFEDTGNPPQPFNYSDTYNSISSVYGWNDTTETCIGGDPNSPDPDALEYTMDVDTFLLDAKSNPDFDRQFKKGDTSMFIKIGANADCVYPNFLIASVDTQKRGELNGECYEDGTCGEGLECDIEHNICVEPETDMTDTATDTDSADTDSADTADTADPDTDTSDSGSNPSDSSNEKGDRGELNGECYPNGTCNEGLTCSKDNICTNPLVLKKSGGCSILTVD